MSKQIIIIGGGISGLSVLHQVKKRFKDTGDVQVLLIEKNSDLGGHIRSELKESWLFEAGPEGFLDSKFSTLELIEELGLTDDLIPAQAQTKIRYLCLRDKLYALPMSFAAFLGFKLLSVTEKLRVLGEFFVPRQADPAETVYQFGCRRFGKRIAQYFFDAMAAGIYGGDIHKLSIKVAFPPIYAFEEKYGSVLRGFFQQIKERKQSARTDKARLAGGQLFSLRQGMGQLIATLQKKYKEDISRGEEAYSLAKTETGYIVETNKRGQ